MQILKKMIWTAALLLLGAIGITYADLVYAETNINEEREIPDQQKVVRGSNVPVLTSHVGLNPRSKRASLSHQASLAALRAGYERKARVINQNTTENNLIYNFKNTKKEGTITFTKKWKDRKNNDDRPIPDVEISTKKPKKNINGYTVTFHGNGMTFADGSIKNEIVFNSAMDIIIGQYKVPGTMNVFWFTEPECINKVNVSKDGIPSIQLTEDIDLYARPVTFVLKSGSDFNKLISDNVNEIRFTDIEMPNNAIAIDVDDDGDNGVVAWNDSNIMYVSTQIEGINIIFQNYSDSMFYGKQKLRSIIFDNIDTRNVKDMQYMFKNCSSLIELNLLQFNTESVKSMSGMFSGCTSLTSLNIKSFNTSSVVYMSSAFQNCISLTELDVSNIDTSKVDNMGDMFNNCKNIRTLDVSKWNTQNVNSMGYMFYDCNSLTTLDVSNWNTGNVKTFVGMFSGCKNLNLLNVSNFNTEKATNLSEMFYNCQKISELDVSHFNTSNVLAMNHMFYGCYEIEVLDVSNFNTPKVKYMQQMFTNCKKVTNFDLSSFETNNVVNMEQMFYGCESIESLDLSSFFTPNVTNMCNMFNLCLNLTNLDISNIDSSKVTNMNWAFSNLNALKTLHIGKNFAFVGTEYGLNGMWMSSENEVFDAMEIPNNKEEIYTRIS